MPYLLEDNRSLRRPLSKLKSLFSSTFRSPLLKRGPKGWWGFFLARSPALPLRIWAFLAYWSGSVEFTKCRGETKPVPGSERWMRTHPFLSKNTLAWTLQRYPCSDPHQRSFSLWFGLCCLLLPWSGSYKDVGVRGYHPSSVEEFFRVPTPQAPSTFGLSSSSRR